MITLNESNFDQTIKSHQTILVDFSATWCGPCRALLPILNKISAQYEVGKVDIQDSPGLAARFGVSSVPTLIVFKNGKSVQTRVGLMNEKAIKDMMEAHA